MTEGTVISDDSKEHPTIVKTRWSLFIHSKGAKILGLTIVLAALIGILIALIVVIAKLDDKSETPESINRKVLFVIVDGIPADVIERLPIPNMKRIQNMGGYTRAYVGGESGGYSETPTISAPGYMTLITGTYLNKHNVSDNDVEYPNYNYKNIFRLYKEHFPEKKIAIFSTWIVNRIRLIGEGLASAGNIIFDYKADGYELDQVTYPHDPDALYILNIDLRVTNETKECVKTYGPDLSWVYLQYTDDVGHEYGDSEEMDRAVNYTDYQIGQIWEAIEYRMKNYKEDWSIIITTDHGRDPMTGMEHGDQTDREKTIWIMTNRKDMNSYFRDFQPAVVDIFPTIAKLTDLPIPIETQRELDGVSMTGNISLIKPSLRLNGFDLEVSWVVVDSIGDVKIWLSITNEFNEGMSDHYKLMKTVPIKERTTIVDIRNFTSNFYKVVLEGQYNMVNRWLYLS